MYIMRETRTVSDTCLVSLHKGERMHSINFEVLKDNIMLKEETTIFKNGVEIHSSTNTDQHENNYRPDEEDTQKCSPSSHILERKQEKSCKSEIAFLSHNDLSGFTTTESNHNTFSANGNSGGQNVCNKNVLKRTGQNLHHLLESPVKFCLAWSAALIKAVVKNLSKTSKVTIRKTQLPHSPQLECSIDDPLKNQKDSKYDSARQPSSGNLHNKLTYTFHTEKTLTSQSLSSRLRHERTIEGGGDCNGNAMTQGDGNAERGSNEIDDEELRLKYKREIHRRLQSVELARSLLRQKASMLLTWNIIQLVGLLLIFMFGGSGCCYSIFHKTFSCPRQCLTQSGCVADVGE
ncbi:hypothetical protein EGW08_003183 [Elysia chlorotica]|uniref:Uncharacterized protein n=1 Tax=Elysia chlorotica TaxID=188477 RepID=A0A3S1ADE5_ELYCH|nr:hypothetical protein EGW08_003183 [Elysia chlorotica]